MSRAVLLAGGWAHPGHDLITTMRSLVERRGFDLAVETHAEQAVETIAECCDLLVVGSCWFAMTDERYSDEQRQQHAVNFDGALKQSFAQLIADGCPLLALHTAVISFDGADPWAGWLGGSWNWTTSWHPEPGLVAVRPALGTPIDFDPFTVIDELYQGLDLHESVRVVAESDAGDPLVWLQQSNGRAAVNLLGHDQRSLDAPGHRQLNEQLLDWLLA